MDAKQTGCGCLLWIAIIAGVAVGMSTCNSGKKAEEKQKANVQQSAVSNEERAAQEEKDRAFICSCLCRSLEELYGFKDDAEFHELGFAISGKYNKWLKSIEKYRDLSHNLPNRFFSVKTAAGKIMQAGFEFMKSGGADTEYTKSTLPDVENAIGYREYVLKNSEKSKK